MSKQNKTKPQRKSKQITTKDQLNPKPKHDTNYSIDLTWWGNLQTVHLPQHPQHLAHQSMSTSSRSSRTRSSFRELGVTILIHSMGPVASSNHAWARKIFSCYFVEGLGLASCVLKRSGKNRDIMRAGELQRNRNSESVVAARLLWSAFTPALQALHGPTLPLSEILVLKCVEFWASAKSYTFVCRSCHHPPLSFPSEACTGQCCGLGREIVWYLSARGHFYHLLLSSTISSCHSRRCQRDS